MGRMDKMFFIKNFAKCIFQTFEKLFVIKEEVEHEVETEIDYPKIDEIQPDIIDYPADLNNIYESNEMMEDFLMDRVSKNFLKTFYSDKNFKRKILKKNFKKKILKKKI